MVLDAPWTPRAEIAWGAPASGRLYFNVMSFCIYIAGLLDDDTSGLAGPKLQTPNVVHAEVFSTTSEKSPKH